MKVVIIGAGMAGSVAAGAMSSSVPVVYDSKKDNGGTGLGDHYAIMRLRSADIGKYLGCGLSEITVYKAVLYGGRLWVEPSITMNNLYSIKTHSELGIRSLQELGKVKRYLLPPFRCPAQVEYDHKACSVKPGLITFSNGNEVEYDVCISTMPMPALLGACSINHDMEFCANPIYIARATLNIKSSVHQTIYIPEPSTPVYRMTLENRVIILESTEPFSGLGGMSEAISPFGLGVEDCSDFTFHTQHAGKMVSVDDNKRRFFIMKLTDEFGIYSFGRYALWKPIRADHLIGDIENIKNMLLVSKERRKYESRLNQFHK